jgi:hypothetical protein
MGAKQWQFHVFISQMKFLSMPQMQQHTYPIFSNLFSSHWRWIHSYVIWKWIVMTNFLTLPPFSPIYLYWDRRPLTIWLSPLFPQWYILGQMIACPMVNTTLLSESEIWSWVLRDPEPRMAVLAKASRNLSYLTLVKLIPVNGDRSSIGRKFHADMDDCWRRLHVIQSLWAL